MVTIAALNKRQVLGPTGEPLDNRTNLVATSDANIAATRDGAENTVWVVGIAAGTATISATRLTDGAVASVEVTVTAGAPFTISLGDEVPA